MKRPLPSRGLLLAALLCSFACSPDAPVGPRSATLNKTVVVEPASILAAAEAGTLGRGEQDLLVRIERQLPGFGGLYLSNGAVRVYMKTTAVPLQTVRDVLIRVYSAHPSASVRGVMANVGGATVIPGQMALTELIALQKRIEASISGWNGVGTNIMANKVVVAFPDSDAMTSGLIAIEALGIPAQALTPIIMLPVRATSYFYSTIRPMRAGPRMSLLNDTYEPHGWKCTSYCYPIDYGQGCTIGFNVNAGNAGNYFMTASHCVNSWRGQNGAVGDSIFQSDRLGGLLGLIAWNVYWTAGLDCPVSDPTTGEHYSFCTTADVALARYVAGVGFERKVGTSMYSGTNGYPGSAQFNNWYPINAVFAPEYVDSTMHHQVHKSGGWTFTTTGPFISDMMDVSGTVCWVDTHYNPCATTLSMLWQNHTVIWADVNGGDSGAPVFTGIAPNNGGPYAALGILDAGVVPYGQFSTDRCPSCYYAFSRWDQIEPRLQLGVLNPQTVF
jgi:hypothetical protein